MPQQKVAASSDASCGRALVAVAPISRGSLAVQVPDSLVVMAEGAARQLALASLLPQHPLPDWSVLALWLAEARAGGPGHDWAPYVAVLPSSTGCVLEWTQAQVEWLRGSHLRQVAGEIRQAAHTSWEEMQPVLRAAEQQGLGGRGVYSQEAVMWAFSMLLTRLIRLPGLADAEVLAPWADLLNHDCESSTHLDWDAGSRAVVLRADRQYRPGEQVFVSYGQKTSGQLLLSYGFLPPPGCNPHDACLLPMQLGGADPGLGLKRAALEEQGQPALQVFPLRMAALPQGLLEFAAFAAAKVPTCDDARQLAARLFGGGGGGRAAAGAGGLTGGSAELHSAALREVVQQCQRALKSYPASLEANKGELGRLQRQREAAAGAGGSLGGAGALDALLRREQVLQVLVQEQQVLNRVVFLLQQQLRQLRKA